MIHRAAVLLLAASVVAGGQDVSFEPTPEPVRAADPVSGTLTAVGSTRYEVEGLTEPELIDGIVTAGAGSVPKLVPFGYVAVTCEEGAQIIIKASDVKRDPLPVFAYGSGYRVVGSGDAWVSVTALNKQTVIIDEQPIEFIKSFEQTEIKFVIETTNGPDPPDPIDPPVDSENPFGNEDGLRVLIIYERDDIAGYESSQQAVIFGAPMREWLNANCSTEDGEPAYRILDKDAEGTSAGAKVWLDAMELGREGLPWLLVGNGGKGYSGPLPQTIVDTQELIGRFK